MMDGEDRGQLIITIARYLQFSKRSVFYSQLSALTVTCEYLFVGPKPKVDQLPELKAAKW